VGRLIWPVLPQKLLKDDLVNFFKQFTALLNRDPHPEKIRTQLAVLPVEAQQAARQIKIMGYSAAEREKINRLIRAMQALVMQSMALLSEPQPLPDNLRSALRPEFDGLEAEEGEESTEGKIFTTETQRTRSSETEMEMVLDSGILDFLRNSVLSVPL
jgi:hypothetical protein